MSREIMQIDTSRLSPKPAEEAKPEPLAPAPAAVSGDTQTIPAVDLTAEQIENLKNQIVAALCTCFDPEIPVNIYELGLIYGIEISPRGAVVIRMTLTSPACPVAGSLPPEVERKVEAIPGVVSAKAELVWDPPWDKSRMSEAAKLQLGIEDY